MLGLNRWHLLKGLAAILSVASIVSLTLIYVFPAPPSAITIASGFQGGNYEIIAELYKRILARNHVNLEMHPGSGGWDNVKLLLDQNSGVQTAFVQGGMGGGEQAPGLLSLGRINYQIFCVFYRATEVLEDLTELKGKRVAAGTVGTGSRVVTEKILGISGVNSENSTLLSLSGQAAVNAINDGRADAAIVGLESDSPLIHSLLRDSRVRLMSVTRAEALIRFFHFLRGWYCRKVRSILRGKFRPAILSSSRTPILCSCAMIFILHIFVSWHGHYLKHITSRACFNEPASSPL